MTLIYNKIYLFWLSDFFFTFIDDIIQNEAFYDLFKAVHMKKLMKS